MTLTLVRRITGWLRYVAEFSILFMFFSASSVFAADANTTTTDPLASPSLMPNTSNISLDTMLLNIGQQLPNLMRLVTALAYVLGLLMIVNGLFKLKQFGEQRTMMTGQRHLLEPTLYIIVGTLLLYLPTTVQVGLSTFWTAPNPYGYESAQSAGGLDQWSQIINTCFVAIQLFGTIAFIKGLIMLSKIGHGGGQQGVSHAIAHIVGGLFCINIYQFVYLIELTLGIQS